MRVTALAAAAVCIGLLAGGVAAARVWNDPNGRVTFDAPNGWATSPENNASLTYVITGNANNECHVVATPNAGTSRATAAQIRAASAEDARFGNETWTRVLNGIPTVFPGNSANVQSRSLDSSGAWPIQRAEVQGPERLVHAAMQLRPGFDIITLCMTYGGADRTDLYDAFIHSVGHPNDAQWAAEATAAPAPAPVPQ